MTLDTPLDFALAYAQAGYRVLPLRLKIPLTEHGAHDATTDDATLRAWWDRWPDANIGMTLDTLVVVDIDPRNGGDVDTLPHPLPETCYAKTGGGGWHYLYRACNGTKYPGTLGAGIDVKHGAGAYIVVEPSVHASGDKYTWLDESEPWSMTPAEAPDWLAHAQSGTHHADDIGAGEAIPEGKRNAHMASLAGSMRRRDMTAEAIQAALLAENSKRCNPPLDDEEIKNIAASVSKYQPSAEQTAPEIIVKCSPLDWAELAKRGEPPARRWALYGWLGFFINLLVGSGGIGKTLLAQQMGSTLALGRAFIDAIDRPLTVLAWFCEDEHDEIWRRQVQIAHWLGVGIEAFRERFIIMPRHGMENALVATEYGRPMFTPLIGELSEQAADCGADVVMLDNAAQVYGGGENDRHAVTFFMNGLAGALPGRAVLLLAHPARSAGSEFSGSGAWENVARNRLYLGAHLPDQQPDADEQPAENVRYLARRKANYTTKDWRRFQYQNGVLVPDAVDPTSGPIGHLYDQAAEYAVLEGLKRLQVMGLHPCEGATTSRYLPRLMLEYKLATGRSKAELAGAMRRLMVDGRLVKAVVGKYAGNRSPMYGLTASE
jgi:hypothetical protein